tara:strand:+ start:2726 stop:5683 length:2958 start_codon:yes stop_codon:yes gene_type:complete
METKVVNLIIKTGDANKSIKKTDKSIKGFKKNTVDAGKSATKSIKGVDSAFNALPSSIQGAVGQVKNLGTSFKALAIGGAVGAIAGLGSLFVMATRKGAEFAKQMSTLKAVSGATTAEIDALSNSAKELGSSTQFTAVEVGELQTEFAKMGFSTKQILASTKATLDLAASMEVGLAEAAQLAGSTVNAFGLEAKDTQRVVDVLAASTSESALDFSSLTEAFKNVAPAAKATNRSVEETSALLGVLANNGIKGSRAGTQLSKAFVELNKKGLPLNEALDKIRNSSNGLKTAMELAGERGGKALLVLSDKRPQIEALTRSFENSAGAANKMAEVRLDNLAGDTTKLSSAWEGFLLSIEDGEGLFSSIARGIVQATTALLNFITPTTKLSESLEKERFALFKTEAELDRLDVKMQDSTISEEDLEKAQRDRVKVIEELKLQYPKYLEDIDSETTSTEDLKKAIDQVNESLINKIIIQEKEEEILEQAEDTAKRRLKLDEKQQAAENYGLKLKQELSDLNIKIKATSPNEILKELNEIELEQNKLRLEGNGQNKLKIGQISDLINKQNNLKSKIKAVNDAEEEYNNEQSLTNKLTEEKDALMKRLNITTEESTNKTDDNSGATGELTKETISLIKIQKERLEEAKKMSEVDEPAIAKKNIKIALINKEIKRLQSLGIEQEKKAVKEIEITNKLNQKLLEQIDIKEDLFGLEEEEEEPEFETDFLAKTEKASKLQTEVKIGAIVNEIEREKQLKLQNLLWNKENIIEQSILDGTYSAEQRLAIETDYLQKKEAIELASAERERRQKLQTANVNLQIAANGLNMVQSLGDAAFAHRMKNLKEGSREQLKAAKQQFNFNKALQLGMAVIDGGKAITASLAQAPIAIGAVPNPAGIASLAFASITSAAQIAMIAAKKYEPNKTSASVSSSPTPSGGGGTAPSQPPSFNVVGTSGINQVSQALNGQQPVQAFVVAGAVTTAQQLQNNTIQTATF